MLYIVKEGSMFVGFFKALLVSFKKRALYKNKVKYPNLKCNIYGFFSSKW